jgi:mono/diheme cytochrome c family protein
MKGRIVTVLATLAAVVVITAAAAAFALFTGAYNVAATERHWGVTRWALGTMQRTSVSARAGEVAGGVPADPDALQHGFEHFHAMCVQCHGAPGIDRGEVGQGMTPRPPRLEEEAHEWSDAELFWITKHGIRLAGMPAFGPTHSDDEIWAIVGFIRQLEGMTEEDYAGRVRELASDSTDDGGHSHAPGTPAHEH